MQPKLISREEIMNSTGIGPSQVAAILNLDPWSDAYEQWQFKTGRKPRPPQTPQMLYGIEMEPKAIARWAEINSVHDYQTQVGAVHRELSFLRGFADIWHFPHLVNVKCPSSTRTMDYVRSHHAVPVHYLIQGAAEMSIFEADGWEFFVYHADDDTASVRVNWGTPINGTSLGEFWNEIIVPELRLFWKRLEEDAWVDSTSAGSEIPRDAWAAAIEKRNEALQVIKEAEERKTEADAEIKRLMGTAPAVSLDGWKAAWTPYKAKFAITIDLENKEKLDEVYNTLGPLESKEGVKSVKRTENQESLRFSIRSVKK